VTKTVLGSYYTHITYEKKEREVNILIKEKSN